MTDARDYTAAKLEELHKPPLSSEHQRIVDDLRVHSPTVASWVETQFRIGKTRNQVWHKLEAMRDVVKVDLLENTENLPHFDPSPIDSAGVDLTNTNVPDDDDVPASQTTDSGG